MAFSSLNTDSIPSLRGEAVELIEEVETLLNRDSDLERMVAYQRVRELAASELVTSEKIEVVRRRIESDASELRALLGHQRAA